MISKSMHLRKWRLRVFWLLVLCFAFLVFSAFGAVALLSIGNSEKVSSASTMVLYGRKVPSNGIESSKPVPRPRHPSVSVSASAGVVLASKTGTKFYLPHCAGVKRIKEENRVWFASVADAYASGYQLAKGCK